MTYTLSDGPVRPLPGRPGKSRPLPLVRSGGPAWSHHRPPQLMQPRPGRLITAQPQHRLQPKRTGTVLLTCQPVHGPQPIHQWLARVLEDRPPPSLRFDDRSADTASTRNVPARNDRSRSSGNESPLASEAGTDTPGKPVRWQTASRTRSDFADILPWSENITGCGYLSQVNNQYTGIA